MDKTLIQVLLIEDNPADALLLKESLGSDLLADFQVTVVERLQQGLAELDQRKFDVALLDLGLPDSQGLETFEIAHTDFPDIPMIVLSGASDEWLALQAVKSGAQDYLVKGETSWQFGARSIRYAIERHQNQLAMRASEARFSTFFHSSPAPTAITRLSDYCIKEANEAWLQATGYSAAEIIGRDIREFNLWVEPEERGKMIGQLRADGIVRGFELQMRRRTGEIAVMLLSAELIELDGETCLLSMALDITERQQAEEAMRLSEERLRVTLTNSNIIVAEVDRDFRYTWIQNPHKDFDNTTIIGKRDDELTSNEGTAKLMALKNKVFVTGVGASDEITFPMSNGKAIYLVLAEPRKNEHSDVIGVTTASIDISERKKVEEALRLSEERHRLISSMVSDYVYSGVAYPGGRARTEWISGAFEQITGYTMEELTSLPLGFASLLMPEDIEMVASRQHLLFENGALTVEYRIRRKDGEIRWLLDRMTASADQTEEDGIKILGGVEDITERKQADEKLRESEERYRLISENAADVIWVMDARADRFTYVSPSVEKLRGYTPAEVLAQPASEALTPESAILVRDALKKRLAEILATGTVAPSYVSEVDQPRKDGSIVHTEVTTTYVLNPDGRVEVIGVSRDITGRKRAELLLVESEARFRTFVEESTDGLAISDEQGLVIEWNPALEKILGIPREQALTLALWDIQSQMLLPENRSAERLDLFRKNLLEAITSGQSPYFGRSYEAVVQTKSGERKVVQQSSFPIKTNKGYRIGAILRDITQKKQAEAALTESEERFRSIYETTGLGIFESTADGQALDVNPAYARMFGFETPEAARQGLADIAGSIYVHPEKREQFVQYVLEHPGLASFENEYRRCDGTTFTGELKLQAMQAVDGQSPHLFGYVEDITERKQAQEKIARAEKRFKSLIENAPDGIVMVGLDGKYKYASPAALRMFNYTRQDVEGGNPVEQTHPEDLTLVLETLQDLIANPSLVPTLQYRFLHKSGSWLWIESTFTNLLAEPSVEAIVINFRDVTERVDAEKQIRASEENSRLAHDAADLGTWQEDLLNHTFILDERARKHYDQDNSHLATAEITSRVFPADVPRLQAAITAILEPVTNGRLELEYRVIHRDGSIHWLAVHTRVHFENRNGVRTAVMAVGTSQDITERKDAEEKLTRRTRQLRLIHEATHRLNVSLDVRHVHEVIYANVSQLMPCDTLFISTFDPASRMITLAGGWHDGSPVDLTPYEPILLEPEGSGIQSQVIRTKEPQSIPDYQARLKKTQVVHHFDGDGQPVDEPPEDADIPRSALMVPLLAEGQVLGVIQVFSYRLNAYTEDDLQILAGFSAQAAIALSNARLYGHVQQENLERKRAEASLLTRTRQLGSLFDIADHLGNVQSEEQALTVVTAEMESLMEAQASGIALLEPDHGHFKLVRATDALVSNLGRRFSMEEGISGWVLQEGRVRIIADYPSDPLRLEGVTGIEDMGPGLFAPIRTESQFAGVLFVLRRKDIDTQPFDENAARLLTAVGEIMGGTLQRVRLFEQTTSQLNQLQTLHKIDRAITGSLDLGLTLRLLLTEITSQPEVDAADILLVNPHNLTLEYAASNGFRTRAVEQMHLLIGQGYAGLTALRREPLHVRDLHNCDEPLRRQIVKEEGFKAYIAAPLIAKGKIVGVLEFYARSTQDYGPDWDNFIETLANQATIAIENARLFTDLQRSNLEMELAFDATLEGWSRAVDLHAHETEGHSSRVAEIAIDLAQAMGMHNEDLIQLRRGALLHDIGKLAIPDEILLKPGPLTDGEWEVIRRHPIIAHEILQSVEYLRGALVIPYCHHENWDGTGYPRRMAGEQIPLAARIFAVADVYETLINDRPYRSAWERRKALAHIEEQAGRQFDPHVVDAFRTWFNTR